MISKNDITAWGIEHPWPETDQIEQDLLLAQAICTIANDELLKDELALRGGTAFHKFFMTEPYRYSEDLDYVRVTDGGIGEIMRRLTDIGLDLGYSVKTKMGMYPKVIWRFTSDSDLPAKIKIEINAQERTPVQGFNFVNFSVDSAYYSGNTKVRIFSPEELAATKIRALYQRSKGRDLYDLWLALNALHLDKETILKIFEEYRPEGLTGKEMIKNLQIKLADKQFTEDVTNMIRRGAPKYDPQEAGKYIIEELLVDL